MQFARQRCALPIVDIHHRGAQPGPREEAALGGPVAGHRAVVVEVVAGEVGEDSDVDVQRCEALFDKADGRGFDGAGAAAGVGQLPQRAVQRDGVGRGEAGGGDPRRLTDAQRTDDTGAHAERAERCGHPPGARGLAVGAGDGHGFQRLAGLQKPSIGQRAASGLQTPQRGHGLAGAEVEHVGAIGLDEAGHGTSAQRIADKAAPVHRVARPGDEGVAGLHLAAVGAQGACA